MDSTGMRKGFIGLMVVGMFILSSCAGSSSYMKPTTERAPLRKDKAIVRFMRPSGYGSPWNINVLDGEKIIGNSVAKSQFEYVADPGRHLFIATVKNQDYLEADLEGGKVYYVFTNLYPAPFSSFWGGMHVAFEPVNQGSKCVFR